MRMNYHVHDVEKTLRTASSDFPDKGIVRDDLIKFLSEIVPENPAQFEKYTTRWSKGNIRVPITARGVVPAAIITPNGAMPIGNFYVPTFFLSHVSDLTDSDAKFIGYDSKKRWVERIGEIYHSQIMPHEVFSIYRLEKFFPIEGYDKIIAAAKSGN